MGRGGVLRFHKLGRLACRGRCVAALKIVNNNYKYVFGRAAVSKKLSLSFLNEKDRACCFILSSNRVKNSCAKILSTDVGIAKSTVL